MNLADFFPMWEKLQTTEQEKLVQSTKQVQYHKGDLVRTGGDCAGLICVVAGQLRAFTLSEDGREITLYRLFERDICLFSASCIMRSIQFEITITAEKETQALVIPPELYKEIMAVSAPLAGFTNEVMASRFSDVMWLIDQVMWKRFDQRLADFLLNEANIEGTHQLRITHEAIGNHLGSPREVVTRMLKYFVAEDLVALSRGGIEILDEQGLEKRINL